MLAIQHPFPAGTLLNVNIPMLPEDQIKGFRTTRQGFVYTVTAWIGGLIPVGDPYYWIGGDTPTGIPEEGTDIGALI